MGKIVTIILIISLVLPVLAACSNDGAPSTVTPTVYPSLEPIVITAPVVSPSPASPQVTTPPPTP